MACKGLLGEQMGATVRQVNFTNQANVAAMVAMIDAYARDPMGGGKPLAPAVQDKLASRLASDAGALGWLAWMGERPVGVLTALWNFSTFAARPRINIHDVGVLQDQRGRGIGWKLLTAVEEFARQNDCCALTLEVRADNHSARHLYGKFGFAGPSEWSPPETMAFWIKTLD